MRLIFLIEKFVHACAIVSKPKPVNKPLYVFFKVI